jgi:hypothetical protein
MAINKLSTKFCETAPTGNHFGRINDPKFYSLWGSIKMQEKI